MEKTHPYEGLELALTGRLIKLLRDADPDGLTVEQLRERFEARYGPVPDRVPLAAVLGQIAAAGDFVRQPEPHGPYVWHHPDPAYRRLLQLVRAAGTDGLTTREARDAMTAERLLDPNNPAQVFELRAAALADGHLVQPDKRGELYHPDQAPGVAQRTTPTDPLRAALAELTEASALHTTAAAALFPRGVETGPADLRFDAIPAVMGATRRMVAAVEALYRVIEQRQTEPGS